MCSHVLSVGVVTLVDSGLFGELSLELDIGPKRPMASDALLDLQNR